MAKKEITSEEYKEMLIKKGIDSSSPLLNNELKNVHYLAFKNILRVEEGISKEGALKEALKFEWDNLRIYTWYNLVTKQGKLSIDEALRIHDESQFHEFKALVGSGLSKEQALVGAESFVVEMGGVSSDGSSDL